MGKWNLLDLFSGIGGFHLGLEMAGFRFGWVGYSDVDEFCNRVYSQHYPDAVPLGNIREIHGKDLPKIDILTGGFPCQPFSCAGKRKGTEDDRHLWPEMLRVIAESRPRWVVAENVRGLISIDDGMVFEQVCVDLENEGYEVQAFVIPACAVNAPHRRDRVFICSRLADSDATDAASLYGDGGDHHAGVGTRRQPLPKSGNGGGPSDATDTKRGGCGAGRERRGVEAIRGGGAHDTMSIAEPDSDAPVPPCGDPRLPAQPEGREDSRRGSGEDPNWDLAWIEVATRLCRVDDGLPVDMDGFKLTKSKHRVQRLKALGNSIVPQVVAEIGKAILEVDRG